MCLDGGPAFKFNESVSLHIDCENQEEVDYYWEKLTADGGEEGNCGWLKDKYGLSWQIIPKNMGELIAKPGAISVMLQMKKIDTAKLQEAGNQKS